MRMPRAALACACLVIGVSNAVEGMNGSLAGAAVDPVTGKWIPGVRVEVALGLETRVAVTDSMGTFVLEGLPEGRGFTMTAAKPGYPAASRTFDVIAGTTGHITFSLPSAHLGLVFPAGGERLIAGTDRVVRWEAAGIDSVRIEFSPDNGGAWYPLAIEVSSKDGAWTWQVPDIPTTGGFIRIVALDRPVLTARNTAPFIITSI